MSVARILVVEDERIVALHLRHLLLNLGYEVPAAVASGDRALREIEASPPDLVLMDINLEGELDGIATAARMPPARRIPVIYLTAYSEEATLARASATNPYGYLLKPFSERELHAMIQVTLARRRSERASDAARKWRGQTEKMAALGQLAAGVAHDFDELLTGIYGQLEALGHQATLHPGLADPIERAFEVAIEKEKLIRRLLAFSGRQKLTPAAIPVSDLVADGTNQLRTMLGAPIQLRTSLPDDLWTARIDPGQLMKALINLAANARDAMPNGGSLTIEGQNSDLDQDRTDAGAEMTSGRYVLLTISDTGAGMSEPVLERAFEPFFSTKPAGDGLGLSLVFGFVRQSGGQISIDSKPGEGTTVRLWLPTAANDLSGTSASVAGDPDDTPGFGGATDTAERGPSTRQTYLLSKTTERHHRAPATTIHGSGGFPIRWHEAENALFASIPPGTGDVPIRLVVEPLPKRNGWDWTVWRPHDIEQAPRHGRATSVAVAMAAAESAARLWAGTQPAVR